MTNRRLRLLAALAALLAEAVGCTATSAGDEAASLRFLEISRSRTVVFTDLGNEADDSQTIVRLLAQPTYSSTPFSPSASSSP